MSTTDTVGYDLDLPNSKPVIGGNEEMLIIEEMEGQVWDIAQLLSHLSYAVGNKATHLTITSLKDSKGVTEEAFITFFRVIPRQDSDFKEPLKSVVVKSKNP